MNFRPLFAVLITQTLFALSLASSPVSKVCSHISSSISSASGVYFPGSPQYAADNYHFANSSSQVSVCSVEPGTPQDAGIILQILGKTRTPFAVKGGGHTFYPNFSSTTGVQIAMSRFNQVEIDEEAQTVKIGTGLIWDEVYEALDPHNMTVVGGRATGVGVAGLVLGGGLSFLTNEYGISAANIVEFELALPNGKVKAVSAESNPDLFFAVRGTSNNFGIVTSITMKAIQQGLVWGGIAAWPLNASTIPAITTAFINYKNNVTDPKAAVNFVVQYDGEELLFEGFLFYNGPTPPQGIFDEFLNISALSIDVSTQRYQDFFLSLAPDFNGTLGYRALDNHLLLENWTPNLLAAVMNESLFWTREALKIDANIHLPYIIELFLPTIFQHSDPGAWPPLGTSSPGLSPLVAQWSWTNSENDGWFEYAINSTIANLVQVAAYEGLKTGLPRYPNYALSNTAVDDIWGERNIALLQDVKVVHDPDNVMGLTGGFKIPMYEVGL